MFAEFEKNIEPFKKLVREAIGQRRRRTHLHALPARTSASKLPFELP